MQLIKAARGRITTHHNEDIGRGFLHRGIDIGHGDGTPADLRIGAPAAGTVTAVGDYDTYGLRIIVTHPDGTWSLVAHLSEEFVERGQKVEQNQRIGTMGDSGGDWPVHCHQEYRSRAGVALDPLEYMTSTASAGSSPVGPPPPQQGDDDMPLIILMTAQHGHYTVAPGFCAGINGKLTSGVQAREQFKGAVIWEVAPDDLQDFIFSISGCPFIPAIGSAWHA